MPARYVTGLLKPHGDTARVIRCMRPYTGTLDWWVLVNALLKARDAWKRKYLLERTKLQAHRQFGRQDEPAPDAHTLCVPPPLLPCPLFVPVAECPTPAMLTRCQGGDRPGCAHCARRPEYECPHFIDDGAGFAPPVPAPPRDCEGDGWYMCKECARFVRLKDMETDR